MKRPWLARVARGLTLGRLGGVPLFAVLLLRAGSDASGEGSPGLIILFVVLAGSDYVDGPLARQAGATSAGWGRIDVAADVLFNLASLTAAAWLGLVGPWVPAIVLLLGLRFGLRTLRTNRAASGGLPEDRAGKWAGVLFYLLVGAVVATVSLGVPSPGVLARLGDLVFFYGIGVFAAGAGRPPGRDP